MLPELGEAAQPVRPRTKSPTAQSLESRSEKRSRTLAWYHAASSDAACMRDTGVLRRCCLVFSTLVGCSTPTPPVEAPTAPAATPPPAPREVWPRFAEVSSWPPVSGPSPLQGHGLEFDEGFVRVSPDARERYLTLVADSSVPDGTVAAEFRQSSGGGSRGPVYVMLKESDAWSYLVLDADGAIVEKNPRGCDGCHSLAVADHLFGPARPSLRPAR